MGILPHGRAGYGYGDAIPIDHDMSSAGSVRIALYLRQDVRETFAIGLAGEYHVDRCLQDVPKKPGYEVPMRVVGSIVMG